MAIFADFGRTGDWLDAAFPVPGGTLDYRLVTATRVELVNAVTGAVTVLTGTGFAGGPAGLTGTVTGFEVRLPDGAGAVPTVQASGLSWSAAEFLAACRAVRFDEDYTRLDALFSLQPLTYDARSAVAGVGQGFWGVTQGLTLVGSDFEDTLLGGAGNDTITPGLSPGREVILGSRGSDTIDLRGIGAESWAVLDYGYMAAGVQVALDGVADTGRVVKGGTGTDTILGVRRTMEAYSFDLYGTDFNDSFTLVTAPGSSSYAFVEGGAGSDTFTLTLNSTVRLGYEVLVDPMTGFGRGIVANLAAGTVDQGVGAVDRIVIWGAGTAALELSATRFDDTLTGSARGEVIFGRDGNDTIMAGAGNDTLYGGDGWDTLYAGDGDDWILPGSDGAGSPDLIDAGAGLNTVDFARDPDDAPDIRNAYWLGHQSLADRAALNVTIDGTGGQASGVLTAVGRTALLNVDQALDQGRLAVRDTALGDTFDVTLAKGQVLTLELGQGADTLRAAGDGILRLEYGVGNNNNLVTQGMVANLAAGVVSDDGFGNTDRVQVGAGVTLQIATTDFSDRITGGAADDWFIVRGGRDTVSGGTGQDTVDFSQDAPDRGGIRVNLLTNVARGTEAPFGVEISGFENAVGTGRNDTIYGGQGRASLNGGGGDDALIGDGYRADTNTVASGQVYRLYLAMLDRVPDVLGHGGWTYSLQNRDITLRAVAEGFFGSREFQQTYGALDDRALVTLLYRNVLDRDPDAAGLADWMGRLAGGLARVDLVLGFSESTEFGMQTAHDVRNFNWASNEAQWADEVYRIYQATLGRAPDAAGFLDWQARLATGPWFVDIVAGFVDSREFQRSYGGLDDTEFVTLLYRNVLDREPDETGLAQWVGTLSLMSRAWVVASFVQSTEFIRLAAPGLKDFMRSLGTDDTLTGGGGYDGLAGGNLSDVFVFTAGAYGTTGMDFEPWDFLMFQGFGYADAADVRAHMRQNGDVVMFEDQSVRFSFAADLATLTDDTFILA